MTDETPTTETPTDEPPDVAVLTVHVRTVRTVKALCPFCGDQHRHEWPAGPSSARERMSHCRHHRRRYRIVVGSDGLPEAIR
jgi:hypothetical protein